MFSKLYQVLFDYIIITVEIFKMHMTTFKPLKLDSESEGKYCSVVYG